MISENLSINQTKTKKSTTGTLKQYHWLSLMSFVAIFFCTTLPVLMSLLERIQDTSRNHYVYYVLIENYYLYWVTSFLAFVTAITLFKYLNNKAEVDFFHSLPILSQHIFLSRYILGIIYFIIPLIFHGIISYFIAVMTVYRDMPTFLEMVHAWTDLIFFYVSVYSFVTFGTIITGNTFMAVCTSFGFMQAPIALIFAWHSLCEEYLDTFSGNEAFMYGVIQFTNPIFARFGTNYEDTTIFHFLLQSAVFFTVSFLCFQKRPSENAANPVALEPFKFVIKGLGVICGGALGGTIFTMTLSTNMFNFLIGSLIIGGILHISFEMLFDLDIRAGLRHIKHFVFFYCIISITALTISMDLTNYDGRLEPIEKISSITWYDLTLESSENIEIFHNMIATSVSKETISPEQETYMNGPVTFHLKNGSSYHRYYESNYLENQEYLDLIHSEEYILGSHYYNLTDDYLNELEKDYTKNQYKSSYNRTSFVIDYTNSRRDLSYEEFRFVYDIIMAQIDEITPDFLRENYPVISIRCRDKDDVVFSIPIYTIHQEALEFLDPPNLSLGDMRYISLGLPEKEVSFLDMDSDLQEVIIAEMTTVYDQGYEYYYSSRSLQHTFLTKELVTIYEYDNLRGFLSYEAYDEILENFL